MHRQPKSMTMDLFRKKRKERAEVSDEPQATSAADVTEVETEQSAEPESEPETAPAAEPETVPEEEPEEEPETVPEEEPETAPEEEPVITVTKTQSELKPEPEPTPSTLNPAATAYRDAMETVISKVNADGVAGEDFGSRLESGIRQLLDEMTQGSLSESTVTLLALGLDNERAVREAEARGEARGLLQGRNEAIEEHLRQRDDSDGIPHPGCGQSAASRPASIFDLAREARTN